MERHRMAYFQSDFHRNQYRMAVRLLFFLSCVSLILVCCIGWMLFFKKVPQAYYAAVTDGQIIVMHPEKS